MNDGRYRLQAVLTLALTAAIAGSVFAGATQGSFCPLSMNASGCPQPLQFHLDATVAPKELPKREFAPVALEVSGEVTADTGTTPPALRELTVEIDKNAAIDARGLPVCPFGSLTKSTAAAARRVCRRSLVGTGVAHIGAPQEEPIRANLSLFNGGTADGVTKLLIHGDLASGAAEPIVSAMRIRPVARGHYGLEAAVRIPPILEGSGSVLDFSLRINRRFALQGTKRSYLAARCFDRHLQAGVKALFVGEKTTPGNRETTTMGGTVVRPCTAAG